MSLKNGNNECGEAINVGRDEKSMWTPLRAYKMIEARDLWVSSVIEEYIFHNLVNCSTRFLPRMNGINATLYVVKDFKQENY